MANHPRPIQQDRRARLEATLSIAHAQLRSAQARSGGDRALQSWTLSDIARLEGLISRLPDDRAPGPHANGPAGHPTAVPDRGSLSSSSSSSSIAVSTSSGSCLAAQNADKPQRCRDKWPVFLPALDCLAQRFD
jgi:hypothetical protein